MPELTPFDYEAAFMDDHITRWMWVRKGRQVGWSQSCSQKRLIKAVSIPNYKAIFTSLNLEDCREKIDYANILYQALSDTRWLRQDLPEKVIDRKLELKFSNGSRLISAFTPLGKSKADIDMDEFSEYQNPRKIYRAAVPIMVYGGQLTVAGRPTHTGSMFSAIGRREGGKYTKFRRFEFFWWDCPTHCRDVARARQEIYDREHGERLMSTDDAIKNYATDHLLEIFDNMLLEDFQQEFEGRESGDEQAFLSWEIIKACSPTGEDAITQYETLDELRAKTEGGYLWAGYDVGRHRDRAELSVFEERDGRLTERYRCTFEKKSFEIQAEELDALMHLPNSRGLAIDATGMGEQIAEEREKRWGSRVHSVKFTSPIKNTMATNLKKLMEMGKVLFIAGKEENFQMHSVRRAYTSSENIIYEVDKEEGSEYTRKHHADIFWARALGLYAYAMSKKLGRPRVGWAEPGRKKND